MDFEENYKISIIQVTGIHGSVARCLKESGKFGQACDRCSALVPSTTVRMPKATIIYSEGSLSTRSSPFTLFR